MNSSLFSCSHFCLSNKKQSAMSKERTGRRSRKRFGHGEAEIYEFGAAKPRPVNMVRHNVLSMKCSAQELSDSNNPGDAQTGQGSVSISPGNWWETQTKIQPSTQVWKQESTQIAERWEQEKKSESSPDRASLDETRWADFVHSCCYLRNIQDSLADGKRNNERRCGEPSEGPIIPFGAMFEYHPLSTRDQSRLHHSGKRVLLGIYLGFALIAGGIWKGDILTADPELVKMDASEIYSWQVNAKEVLISWKGEYFVFPKADGTPQLSERLRIRRTHSIRERSVWSEDSSGELQGESEEPHSTARTDHAEARNDFRSIQGDFIVISQNLVLNSMCRRKKRSLFHSSFLTSQGWLTQIWTSCKRNASTFFGISTRTKVCQIRRQVPQIYFIEIRNVPKDKCGPVTDWQKFKRLRDQITCCQMFGQIPAKPSKRPEKQDR